MRGFTAWSSASSCVWRNMLDLYIRSLCNGGLISYYSQSRVREVSLSAGRIQSGQNLGQNTHIKLPLSILAAEFLLQRTTVWMFVSELRVLNISSPPSSSWINNAALRSLHNISSVDLITSPPLSGESWLSSADLILKLFTRAELPASLRGSENYQISPHVEQNNFSQANCKLGMWFYLARRLRELISWSLSVKLS